MKRICSFLLSALMMVSTVSAVDLYVDMDKLETDTPPTIVSGRTMVPLRAIFEAIGAKVEWNSETRTATGTKKDTIVVIQIDNKIALVNGESKELDVPAQLINDRTMVPARFISESMGCTVTWDPNTQTAAVANELKEQHFYVTATGEKYHYSETCNGGTYYEATLAEAVGRNLDPCDKCVLSTQTEPVDELLFAKERVRFYYIGYEQNEDGYVLNLRIENDSDYKITGRIAPDAQVGNKKADMVLSFNADPGRTAMGTITISNESLEKAGVTDFKTIKAAFSIHDTQNLPYALNFGTGFITIKLK